MFEKIRKILHVPTEIDQKINDLTLQSLIITLKSYDDNQKLKKKIHNRKGWKDYVT